MSHWTGKYVIGLTGNIGTGKSVIRKMLEHLGAFGIDADGLSHQATAKGGPPYDQVVQAFGEFVVGEDGQIDRQALGNIVFANPKALAKLGSDHSSHCAPSGGHSVEARDSKSDRHRSHQIT